MRRWEIGIIVALSIFVSLVYYYPILSSGNNLGIQDWDQNFAWTEYTRESLLNFHQFPWWNPYICGGTVQFANPQVPVISFQTIFALLFGTLRGIKLSIFFHGVIGFIGFYLLARQYKLSYMGSLLASIIFSFSGITGSFLSTGMVVFTSIAYTPYILFCFNKSLDNRKWGIICGVLFALSFYFAHQICLLLGMYIFIYALATSLVNRTITPFKALVVMFFSSVIIMLPKLVFTFQFTRIYHYLTNDISGYSIQNLFYFLLSQNQNLFNVMRVQGFFYNIDENSIYIGILPLVLFIIFYIRNKKGLGNILSLVLTLLIITWIMLGDAIYPSLYNAIQHLPVYSSFRVAQRYRFDFIIPFSLIAGLGLDNVIRLLQKYIIAIPLSITCLVVVFIDLTLFSTTNFLSKALIIKNPESQLSRGDTFIQINSSIPDFEIERTIQIPDQFLNSNILKPWSYEYLTIKQNNGVIDCYDLKLSDVHAIGSEDNSYQGEVYLMKSDQYVKVENIFWSPNKLIYKITNAEKALDNTLIINQNFYPGWIVKTNNDACKRVTYNNGLLATKLDSFTDRITFEFNPFLYYTLCK